MLLTDEERRALDTASARTGRSVAALIREAVDAMYGDERSVEQDIAAMRQAFGSWADREGDGAEWMERVRSGRRLQDLR
jgi:hypothetical protein